MKINKFETREKWLEARNGLITGSKLKDILVKRGTGEKKGFYQLIAERVAVPEESGETPIDRGVRLEPEALELFAKQTKKKLNTDLVMWVRSDNESIAYSPDAYVLPSKGKKITEVAECKCLASASHLEAYLTQKTPTEYQDQVLQAFVVNDDLEKLYLVFYDPRIKAKSLFYLVINRGELLEDIKFALESEKTKLAEVEKWVKELTY